jgi:putative membrane protein
MMLHHLHPEAEHVAGLPAPVLLGLRAWDVVLVAMVAAAVVLYATGVRRLWRHAGVGHGVRTWQVGCYAAGIAFVLVALVSRLDAFADVLFSAHMSQHELLMLVAAPLVVLGKPFVAGAWSLPDGARERVLGRVRDGALPGVWRFATHPLLVLALHGVVLWVWHVPALFEAALASESVHALQHAMFFATAVLFWWALIDGRYGRAGYGVSVAYVFATAMHSGLLGVLATLAHHAWYPTHASRTAAAGGSALADQQLAGLIMWIPAGVIFTAIGLALFVAWLGESERRVARTRFQSPEADHA